MKPQYTSKDYSVCVCLGYTSDISIDLTGLTSDEHKIR